jgi:hypothetical protein
MNRLRPTDRTVLALHILLRTKELTSSSKIGDLDTPAAPASDYPRVGIAQSGKIFHYCHATAHAGNRQPVENCTHSTQDVR